MLTVARYHRGAPPYKKICRLRNTRMELAILGMHHTGTSILSNFTMKLGIYGGEEYEFLRHTSNPLKFWELADLVELNQKHLAKGSLFPKWIGNGTEEIHSSYDKGIEAIISRMRSRSSTWIVKDPRLTLFAERWIPKMRNPVCIALTRSPEATIGSLMRYTGEAVTISEWARVYARYYGHIRKACANTPTIIVEHEELLSRPYETMKTVFDSLTTFDHNQGLRMPERAEFEELLFGASSKRPPIFKNSFTFEEREEMTEATDAWKELRSNNWKNKTLTNLPAWPHRRHQRNESYVTLITSSDTGYLQGAIALGKSIRRLDPSRNMTALVTTPIDVDTVRRLEDTGWTIRKVPYAIKDMWIDRCAALTLDQSKRWGGMSDKLWLWTLPFERVVYMDTDTILLRLPDQELQEIKDFGAEMGKYHSNFNAGVMILTPNTTTFQRLMEEYADGGPQELFGNSVDCTEQGLLNQYFAHAQKFRVGRPDTIDAPDHRGFAVHWITHVCPKPWETRRELPNWCNNEFYEYWDRVAGFVQGTVQEEAHAGFNGRRLLQRFRDKGEYDAPSYNRIPTRFFQYMLPALVVTAGAVAGFVFHRIFVKPPEVVHSGMTVAQAKQMGFQIVGHVPDAADAYSSTSDDEHEEMRSHSQK